MNLPPSILYRGGVLLTNLGVTMYLIVIYDLQRRLTSYYMPLFTGRFKYEIKLKLPCLCPVYFKMYKFPFDINVEKFKVESYQHLFSILLFLLKVCGPTFRYVLPEFRK